MSARPRIERGMRSWHQWRLWLAGLIGSRYDGLTHFRVVEPGVLLRCGQPTIADLEHIRQAHGLRALVCARGGTRHPLRGRWFRKERAWCAQRGITLVHLPFSDAALPPSAVFEQFLDVVRASENRPVLVHCEQGFHRTGVLCAAYRIALGGWTLEQALAEMATLGFEATSAKRRPLLEALQAWAAQKS